MVWWYLYLLWCKHWICVLYLDHFEIAYEFGKRLILHCVHALRCIQFLVFTRSYRAFGYFLDHTWNVCFCQRFLFLRFRHTLLWVFQNSLWLYNAFLSWIVMWMTMRWSGPFWMECLWIDLSIMVVTHIKTLCIRFIWWIFNVFLVRVEWIRTIFRTRFWTRKRRLHAKKRWSRYR